MKRNALFAFLFLLPFFSVAQINPFVPKKDLMAIIDKNLKDAVPQYKYLMKTLPADRLTKTFQDGKLVTSDSGWWCSGFYPGTLLYLYEATKDQSLYDEAISRLKLLEKEQNNTHTHDLGFMMYCSFGNANRIKPSAEYKAILTQSAKSLSTRFNDKVGCIRSWDRKAPEFWVIIDNMMNLELLTWATRNSDNDPSFRNIALIHANTTIKNHFRPDYSSFHVVVYDDNTGAIIRKQTAQGAADNSAWSRGQAWGLYGYSMMYRETKAPKYLEQAKHIADFILKNPNLPADKIPYWDYNAPKIPNTPRDASAAAVMASAFIELSSYVDADSGRKYLDAAETILRILSKPQYKAKTGENGGFLLKHSVGSLPGKSEVDVPLTYADYYFVEAMLRYQKLAKR
ncbi:MAG: glycoside hydrolase family 88 protein [Mucilaginibacter polytrichastri]|nr:glycoside hydrolase family 88 protein [Mucilaginibacter polytrichastri]